MLASRGRSLSMGVYFLLLEFFFDLNYYHYKVPLRKNNPTASLNKGHDGTEPRCLQTHRFVKIKSILAKTRQLFATSSDQLL